MLKSSEINIIKDWLRDKSKTLDYGSLSIEIKFSGNRPPLIRKTISEQFIDLDGNKVVKE